MAPVPLSDGEIGTLTPPPDEDLTQLLDLAEKGFIRNLLSELGRIEEADPRSGSWLGQVRAFAQGFQTKRLRSVLRAQIDSRSPRPLT